MLPSWERLAWTQMSIWLMSKENFSFQLIITIVWIRQLLISPRMEMDKFKLKIKGCCLAPKWLMTKRSTRTAKKPKWPCFNNNRCSFNKIIMVAYKFPMAPLSKKWFTRKIRTTTIKKKKTTKANQVRFNISTRMMKISRSLMKAMKFRSSKKTRTTKMNKMRIKRALISKKWTKMVKIWMKLIRMTMNMVNKMTKNFNSNISNNLLTANIMQIKMTWMRWTKMKIKNLWRLVLTRTMARTWLKSMKSNWKLFYCSTRCVRLARTQVSQSATRTDK